MCDKLEHGHLHIAVFGKVSAGKSSLLNALLGEQRFEVSPLHGATKKAQIAEWKPVEAGGVHLIDTPGINELDGEAREKMAFEVAGRSDLVIFVVDGDMSSVEVSALASVSRQQRPVVLALNKVDRYTDTEVEQLLAALRGHADGLVAPDNIVPVMADPRPITYIKVDEDGFESESTRQRAQDISLLTERIWHIVDTEGKTLAALNASLFAGQMSDTVAARIAEARREISERVVATYSIGKGVAVALNPVPVADLIAAAAMDVALVVHLSKVYGSPVTRTEAGRVIATIAGQLAALMGTVWGVNVVSSALKGASAGLSTALTAGTQGALAYYATYLVGRAAERYLILGRSWGEEGPKRAVEKILDGVDRNSILAEAKTDILRRLKGAT